MTRNVNRPVIIPELVYDNPMNYDVTQMRHVIQITEERSDNYSSSSTYFGYVFPRRYERPQLPVNPEFERYSFEFDLKGLGKAKCLKKMAQKRVVLSLTILLHR